MASDARFKKTAKRQKQSRFKIHGKSVAKYYHQRVTAEYEKTKEEGSVEEPS